MGFSSETRGSHTCWKRISSQNIKVSVVEREDGKIVVSNWNNDVDYKEQQDREFTEIDSNTPVDVISPLILKMVTDSESESFKDEWMNKVITRRIKKNNKTREIPVSTVEKVLKGLGFHYLDEDCSLDNMDGMFHTTKMDITVCVSMDEDGNWTIQTIYGGFLGDTEPEVVDEDDLFDMVDDYLFEANNPTMSLLLEMREGAQQMFDIMDEVAPGRFNTPDQR